MRKSLLLGAILALSACGQGNIYDQPIPTNTDTLVSIRDKLPQADQAAWSSIVQSKFIPAAPAIDAKTIGEAIKREKAKDACFAKYEAMEKAASAGLGEVKDGMYDQYNAGVHGYNGCLKMVV